MKVFVASELTGVPGDYAWTVPGELVHMPPVVCRRPGCGCTRSMRGFVSQQGTSCFVVRDLDFDPDTYTRLLWETLLEDDSVAEGSDEDEVWVRDWAREHLELAASLPAEVPLAIDDGKVLVRSG